MKNSIITTFITLFFSLNICYSQDIITKKNKEFIQAKVIDSNEREIIYKQFFNQDGPTYIISKTELLNIHYESGKLESYKDFLPSQKFEDIINDSKSGNQTKKTNSFDESLTSNWGDTKNKNYSDGDKDAQIHYDGYRAAGTVTFLVSAVPFYGIIWGLAPAIIFSAIPPSNQNLNYPNEKLMKNEDYHYAYTKKAHKIKKSKVMKNYGIGILTGTASITALLFILVSTSSR